MKRKSRTNAANINKKADWFPDIFYLVLRMALALFLAVFLLWDRSFINIFLRGTTGTTYFLPYLKNIAILFIFSHWL